jgi:hypothetical protein
MDQNQNDLFTPFDKAVYLFIRALDEQITIEKLRKKDNKLGIFLFEIYLEKDIYRFFRPSEILNTTSKLFENIENRTFILEVADRLSIYFMSEPALYKNFIDSIVLGICNTHLKKETDNLIPAQIFLSIEVTSIEEITSLLFNNIWLLVIFLIKMFYDQSNYFKHELKSPT